jgi:hypothetical protein
MPISGEIEYGVTILHLQIRKHGRSLSPLTIAPKGTAATLPHEKYFCRIYEKVNLVFNGRILSFFFKLYPSVAEGNCYFCESNSVDHHVHVYELEVAIYRPLFRD